MALCPVCKSDHTEELINIKNIPIYCNLMWESRDAAVNCPKGDISLEFCSNCGHVFNSAFDPEKMDYNQAYENSLHFSEKFQEFARSLVVELIEKHDIKNKDIVEIGCGKGDFLQMICEIGDNRGTGFDRSYDPGNETDNSILGNIRFVQEFYSKKFESVPVEFLICRHVLEHIEKPIDFIDEIKSTLNGRSSSIYFEVPNILYTLRDLGIWDLIYEHCGYFTPNSLAFLFKNEGLQVQNTKERYSSQFLGIEAITGNPDASILPTQSLDEVIKLARGFGDAYRQKVTKWQKILEGLDTKESIVVWGGGSKGVTFVNILNSDKIKAVVDINPRKQDKFLAGTGQKYISPEDLISIKPDVIIIMNDVYLKEISKTLQGMNLSPEILIA